MYLIVEIGLIISVTLDLNGKVSLVLLFKTPHVESLQLGFLPLKYNGDQGHISLINIQ